MRPLTSTAFLLSHCPLACLPSFVFCQQQHSFDQQWKHSLLNWALTNPVWMEISFCIICMLNLYQMHFLRQSSPFIRAWDTRSTLVCAPQHGWNTDTKKGNSSIYENAMSLLDFLHQRIKKKVINLTVTCNVIGAKLEWNHSTKTNVSHKAFISGGNIMQELWWEMKKRTWEWWAWKLYQKPI